MQVLERRIEATVVDYAKKLRMFAYKMNGFGTRSWPDRLFLAQGGRVLFVEFKRAGEKPTPLQAHCHEKLRALGFRVEVVDDVGRGKKLLEELTR